MKNCCTIAALKSLKTRVVKLPKRCCGLFLCPDSTTYGSLTPCLGCNDPGKPLFEDFSNGKWAAVFSCLQAINIKQICKK